VRTYVQGAAPVDFDTARAKVLLALVLDNRELVDNDVTRNYLIHHAPSLTLFHEADDEDEEKEENDGGEAAGERKRDADPDATLVLAFDAQLSTVVVPSPFPKYTSLARPASGTSVAEEKGKRPQGRRRSGAAISPRSNTFTMRERLLRGFCVGTRLVWDPDTAPPTRDTQRYAAFYVEALYVDTKRAGIGTQILQAAARHALRVTDRGEPLDTVVLQAVHSPPVLAFYRALGFVDADLGPDAAEQRPDEPQDTIWMECPVATLLRPQPD